jgi:hypothetical protein
VATFTGARGTTAIQADQRIHNMGKTIKLLTPDETPFTTLLMNLRKERTGDPKFEGLQDELEPRFDAINGTTGTGTSIIVDNGSYFAEHDLVVVTRTGEMVRVVSVASNTLTVVRGVGGSAVAVADNDELAIVGSAQPEGDTSKPARSNNATKVTGYTQIFRRPWHITNTALASENETSPHDWDQQALKVGIEHKRDINRAFMFNPGSGSEDTSGSQPRRTTKGLIGSVTTNLTDAGGALTETEFNTFMRSIGRYGNKRRTLIASPLVAGVLNSYAAGKVQLSQSEKTYGVDVQTFTGPFGALRLVVDWELEGSKWGGYAIAVDWDSLAYRWLGNNKLNRDSHVETNIQARDEDGRKDEWVSEVGLEVRQEKTMGILYGVTS